MAGPSGDPRDDLLAERARAAERVDSLRRDLDEIIGASQGSNADDEHDPEGATIAFERAQVAALLDQARGRLVAVGEALERWNSGRYGRCTGCGRPIDSARLAARPTASTCIGCAPTRAPRPR